MRVLCLHACCVLPTPYLPCTCQLTWSLNRCWCLFVLPNP